LPKLINTRRDIGLNYRDTAVDVYVGELKLAIAFLLKEKKT